MRLAGPPPVERAPIAGMIADVLEAARANHCAPQLELGAAAGVGRDLWDEPCEQWVRIPDDAPAGSYVSLRVVGESMDPLLHTGDSVLVQVGATVARDTVVLARVPDAGYVVKRVGRVTRAELELQSLNDAFPPIVVPRDERTVVGTVVLRWCPHARAERRRRRVRAMSHAGALLRDIASDGDGHGPRGETHHARARAEHDDGSDERRAGAAMRRRAARESTRRRSSAYGWSAPGSPRRRRWSR